MSGNSVITVKIPKEMKKKMDEFKMNWSDYIRKSIESKIQETELRKASQKLDEIRSKSTSVSTKELVAWVREDRDDRH
ncbi:MAG: hypothetical protein ACHQ1H_00040 [Nitrososphaerales archaeon]